MNWKCSVVPACTAGCCAKSSVCATAPEELVCTTGSATIDPARHWKPLPNGSCEVCVPYANLPATFCGAEATRSSIDPAATLASPPALIAAPAPVEFGAPTQYGDSKGARSARIT